MTEKDLRHLSRADLLEMLIDQSMELKTTQKKLRALEKKLSSRRIAIDEAGSIAEASLKLNGVFEAAQAACEQYMENIRSLSDRQEEVSRRREEESVAQAAARLEETERRCAAMEAETTARCEAMLTKARTESVAYWDDVFQKLDAFYTKYAEARELNDISRTDRNEQ